MNQSTTYVMNQFVEASCFSIAETKGLGFKMRGSRYPQQVVTQLKWVLGLELRRRMTATPVHPQQWTE